MSANPSRRAVCAACSQQCGIVVTADESGQISKISGDREHPVSQGFICPKGAKAHRLRDHPGRLRQPLRRLGPRGADRWEEVSWDEALDDIATRLHDIATESGPEAVAYDFGTFHSPDWGIGERFMNLFGSPNSIGQDKICLGPIALAEALTYGFGPSRGAAMVPGSTGTVLLWGHRPSTSGPLVWKKVLRTREAGAALLVVDPERTKEAELADLWVQPTPGTDSILMMGVIRALIESGAHDARFVEAHTVGFDALAEAARRYDPAVVSAACGVPASKVLELAEALSRSTPAAIIGGNGLCQSGPSAVENGRALACLIAVTGNLGPVGANQLQGVPRDVVSNGSAYAADALSPEQRAKRLGALDYPYLGHGYYELDEAVRKGVGSAHSLSWLCSGHEPSLWRAIVDGEPYQVRAVILQAHNALGSSANAEVVHRALTSPRLELLVAHDLFMTATSRLADYLLPAAHWLEKPFFSLGLGYMAASGDHAEAKHAVLKPDPGRRSDYELFRDLGRRLNQADRWPDTADQLWESLLAPSGWTFDALANEPGPVRGARLRARSAEPAEPASTYGTPSGRIELRSSLMERWGLDAVPAPRLPSPDPTFPLVLTTGGRVINGYHQDAQLVDSFRKRFPDPVVRMHPETAAANGLEPSSWVRIETSSGAVEQRLEVTDLLAPGVVHADRWWYPERGDDRDDPFGFWSTNINVCTDDAPGACDPVMGSWHLRSVHCRVMPGRPIS